MERLARGQGRRFRRIYSISALYPFVIRRGQATQDGCGFSDYLTRVEPSEHSRD